MGQPRVQISGFPSSGVTGPGPSSGTSTDNAIVRWDGITGTLIQDSSAIISDNGDVTFTTATNSATALQLKNAALKGIIIASTERPDLSASSNPTTFQVLTNGLAQAFAGSSKTVDVQLNRVELGSGTQSSPVRAFRGIVAGSGSLVSSSNTKAGEFLNTWTSTGTLGTAIGAEYSVFAGGAAQVAGLISSAIAQRLLVGFNGGTIGGSMSSATYLNIEEPSRTDGSNTITQLNGISIADLKKTGVTDSYVILIANQSSGGYAIRTGTGLNEFGDQLFINGSQDITQLLVQANATQTTDLVVIENSAGTDMMTISGTGDVTFTTATNSATSFRTTDQTGFSGLTIDNRRPNLVSGTDSILATYAPVGGNAVVASAKRNIIQDNSIVYNSGTHTGGTIGIRARLNYTNAITVSTVEGISAKFQAVWQSTGTASRIVGLDNSIIAGKDAGTTTGLVSQIFCNKAEVGFTSATAPGSIATAIGFYAFAPRNTNGSQTITSLTGFYAADQMTTGVTASYAIDLADQSAGGYAIRTGTGLVEFGDDVGVKTTGALVSTFEVNGSQGRKVTTLAAATLTLDATHDLIAVTYTGTGTVAIALPSATSAWNSTDGIGRSYTIEDTGANAGTFNITINRAGADTIINTTTGNTSHVVATNGKTTIITAVNSSTWKVST